MIHLMQIKQIIFRINQNLNNFLLNSLIVKIQMGQQTSSQQIEYPELTKNYIFEKRCQHGFLLKHKKSNDSFLLKQLTIMNSQQFKNMREKYTQQKENFKQNQLNLIDIHSITKNNFCSATYKLYLIFEYPRITLEDQIIARSQQLRYFQEQDLWSILQSCLNGFQGIKEERMLLLPKNIYITNEGTIKLLSKKIVNDNSKYVLSQGVYYAPQRLQNFNRTERGNSEQKQIVFSLAMCILNSCILKNCFDCYSYNDKLKFDYKILQQKLVLASEKYSKQLIKVLRSMLQQNPNRRSSFIQIQNMIEDGIVSQEQQQQQQEEGEQQNEQQQQEQQQRQQKQQIIDNKQKNVQQISGISHKDSILKQIKISTQNINPTINNNKTQKQQKKQTISPYSKHINQQQSIIQKNTQQNINFKYLLPINTDNKISNLPNHYQKYNQQDSYTKNKQNIYHQTSTIPYTHKYNPSNLYQQNSRIYNNLNASNYNTFQTHKYTASSIYNYPPLYNQSYGVDTSKSILMNTYGNNNLYNISYQPNTYNITQNNNQYETLFTDPKLLEVIRKDVTEINQKKYYPPKTYQSDNFYPFNSIQSFHTFDQDFTSNITHNNSISNIANYQNIYPIKKDHLPSPIQQKQPITQKQHYLQQDKSQNISYCNEEAVYEGFKNSQGLKNGKGKLTYSNGAYYQGYFLNDRMHGYGVLYYYQDKPAYQGQWKEDAFQGKGKLYNQNPIELFDSFNCEDFNLVEDFWKYYEGQFFKDNKHGYGFLYLTNGQIFEGYFENDAMNGLGKFINIKKKQLRGEWVNNKLVKVYQN